jgi:hypothetical protein
VTAEFRRFVGRWRLVVSDALLAFIERAFVDPAPEPERAQVRAEALAEAAAAELEIQPDGTIISRAGPHEFYRLQLPTTDRATELTFEKAPGQLVTLKLLDDGSLLAIQPGKPDASFVPMSAAGSPRAP